jgi:restriction endonuclease Mrr
MNSQAARYSAGVTRPSESPFAISLDLRAAASGFIGTAAFSKTAGELRYQEIGGNTYVSGDTNGDGLADFLIRLAGSHALTSSDFVL